MPTELHFNRLTPAEDEALALLAEECAEVIQAITKIQRHGFGSVDPSSHAPGKPTNREKLEEELGDVWAAFAILQVNRMVRMPWCQCAADRKLANVTRWLHHVSIVPTRVRP